MTKAEIHQKLTTVFRDVFDNPGMEITDTTTADDVDGWDSIMHVNLIVAVEKAFGVSFTTKDVKSMANVGDFIQLIAKRIG
jgi:acyl carrier protein